MAASLTSSTEFASILSKLHRSPEDPDLKQMVLKYLPEIRYLAQTNPLALYHLAYIYPPNSSRYKQMIMQAADLGCTNAMFSACQLLVKTTNSYDLKKAVEYFQKISVSEDTYIKEQSDRLLHQYPQLAVTKEPLAIKNATATNAHRFFLPNTKTIEKDSKDKTNYPTKN